METGFVPFLQREPGTSANPAASHNVIGPDINLNVTEGVDLNNIILIAQISTGQRISGVVTNTSGVAFASVNMFASRIINGTNYNVGASTDVTGHYQLVVLNGSWNVGVSQSGLGSQGYAAPTNQSVNVANNQVTVNFAIAPFTNQKPLLNQLSKLPGQFQFQVGGEDGRAYRVDASTNLSSPANWISLFTNTANGGSFLFIDPAAPANPKRFYRAVLVP